MYVRLKHVVERSSGEMIIFRGKSVLFVDRTNNPLIIPPLVELSSTVVCCRRQEFAGWLEDPFPPVVVSEEELSQDPL